MLRKAHVRSGCGHWFEEGKGGELSGGRDELQIAVAALLVETARVDDDARRCASGQLIDRLLERRFGVSAERGGALEQVAERRAERSAQLFGFARTINERLPRERRIEMIEMLWEVAYADGVLDPLEDTSAAPDRRSDRRLRSRARRGPAARARTARDRRGGMRLRAPRQLHREECCAMTYVVTEACIKCKYMDCVEVCPVDCFYEGENMLVIHPDECIDCGVCEPECPAEAIVPDSEPEAEKWLELNRAICRDLAEHHPQGRRRRPMPTTGRMCRISSPSTSARTRPSARRFDRAPAAAAGCMATAHRLHGACCAIVIIWYAEAVRLPGDMASGR